jgi:hypothetical protein
MADDSGGSEEAPLADQRLRKQRARAGTRSAAAGSRHSHWVREHDRSDRACQAGWDRGLPPVLTFARVTCYPIWQGCTEPDTNTPLHGHCYVGLHWCEASEINGLQHWVIQQHLQNARDEAAQSGAKVGQLVISHIVIRARPDAIYTGPDCFAEPPLQETLALTLSRDALLALHANHRVHL